MKWKRCAGVAVLFGVLAVSSVEAQGRTIRGGVAAGITSATLNGDGAEEVTESKIGLLFGGFLSVGLSRNLALETGAFYSQRGAKLSEGGITAKLKLNYVEVPAHVTLRLPGSGSVTPFVGFGPALGLKVGCSLAFSGGGGSVSTDCNDVEDELGSDLKGVDVGLSGTAGVDVKAFRVAIAYYLGLSSIDGSDDPADVKNRVFSVSVGYGFVLR